MCFRFGHHYRMGKELTTPLRSYRWVNSKIIMCVWVQMLFVHVTFMHPRNNYVILQKNSPPSANWEEEIDFSNLPTSSQKKWSVQLLLMYVFFFSSLRYSFPSPIFSQKSYWRLANHFEWLAFLRKTLEFSPLKRNTFKIFFKCNMGVMKKLSMEFMHFSSFCYIVENNVNHDFNIWINISAQEVSENMSRLKDCVVPGQNCYRSLVKLRILTPQYSCLVEDSFFSRGTLLLHRKNLSSGMNLNPSVTDSSLGMY